jgi:hypothetical protein
MARGGAIVSAAPTRATAHIAAIILAMIWPAISLAVFIENLPEFAHGCTRETFAG